MATNTTVALLVAAAGGLAVWTGIVDPPGGIAGALSSVLGGKPVTSATPSSAAAGLTKFVGALYTTPGAASGSGGGAVSADFATSSGKGAAVVALAEQQVGVKYTYGGEDPATGFDCSGLVQYCFLHAAGLQLPRVAAAQALVGQAVPLDALQPGDLVFWGVPAYHVAISLGGDQLVYAPYTGAKVKTGPIYSRTLAYGRRVLAAGASSTSTGGRVLTA